MKRTDVILNVVLILLLGILPACNSLKSGQSASPATGEKMNVVSAQKVSAGPMSKRLYLTGEAVPARLAGLASPAEGPVKGLSVREGAHVKAGERLLSIDRKEGAEALVAMQREKLRKEEENLKRVRELVRQEAVPGERLDEAMVSYELARSEYVLP